MLFRVIATSVLVLSADSARIKFKDTDTVTGGQCPRTVAEAPNQQGLQPYFDQQRAKLGLLESGNASPETCTKRDVCLLMRQLDMDFYQRARAGTLTDMDFDTLPELSWVHAGTCESSGQTRGKRFTTVTDEDKCKDALRQVKGKISPFSSKGPKVVDTDKLPSGCVIVHNNKRRSKKLYMNTNAGSTAKAGHFTSGGDPKRPWKGWTKDKTYVQLCEQDRSLSESAATYYSPYKLKHSMVHKPQKSTSCSFGMYAYLAKLRETQSSCARLLTTKTHKKFPQAADALKMAQQQRAAGNDEMANELEAYVRDVKTKYVLIDTIANKWCPGVWNEAISSSSGTCKAPRMASWAADVKKAKAQVQSKPMSSPNPSGRAGAMGGLKGAGNADRLSALDDMLAEFMKEDDEIGSMIAENTDEEEKEAPASSGGRPDKIALSDDVCAGLEDETLASILENSPDAPPDFFRFLDGEEFGEHPALR